MPDGDFVFLNAELAAGKRNAHWVDHSRVVDGALAVRVLVPDGYQWLKGGEWQPAVYEPVLEEWQTEAEAAQWAAAVQGLAHQWKDAA